MKLLVALFRVNRKAVSIKTWVLVGLDLYGSE